MKMISERRRRIIREVKAIKRKRKNKNRRATKRKEKSSSLISHNRR